MRGPLSLISTSLSYARTQQTLVGVTLWLLLLPGVVVQTVPRLMEERAGDVLFLTTTQQSSFILITFLIMLACSVVMLWGGACVIVIGRKLVRSRAGRKRSSVRSVMGEARTYIIPLILTGILRACMTLLWSLLLVIPGIIYAVRTSMYSIIVITEGISYRASLRRSKEIVSGATWAVLWRTVAIFAVLFLPIHILSIFFEAMTKSSVSIGLPLMTDVIIASLFAPMTALSTFAMMVMFDDLKRR
ncbi:hypothetical protein FJZ27_01725 [Candidatus Peribacteria bacterium]|nr:hypothetical protein [Candidatus Peribacteria bacterium]